MCCETGASRRCGRSTRGSRGKGNSNLRRGRKARAHCRAGAPRRTVRGMSGRARDAAPGPAGDETRTDPPPGGDVVVVFVREPEPGRVKTRLAAAIGDAGAASL